MKTMNQRNCHLVVHHEIHHCPRGRGRGLDQSLCLGPDQGLGPDPSGDKGDPGAAAGVSRQGGGKTHPGANRSEKKPIYFCNATGEWWSLICTAGTII